MDTYLCAGKRTPIGAFQGSLSKVPATKLGSIVIKDVIKSSNINPQDIDSKALADTADYINNDDRVYNFLVPIRDGLMVCIKDE